MLKRNHKRALALALVIQILGGALFPTQAFAFTTKGKNNHGVKYIGSAEPIGDNLEAQGCEVLYYYSKDIKEGFNQFTKGNSSSKANADLDMDGDGKAETVTDKRNTLTYKIYKIKNKNKVAQETLSWGACPDSPDFQLGSEWHRITDGHSGGKPSTQAQVNTFTDVLKNIDDSLGQSATEASIFKDLNALKSSSGAQGADLSNINQRLAAVTYMRLNPELFFKLNGKLDPQDPRNGRDHDKYAWDSIDGITDTDYQSLLVSSIENKDTATFTQYLVKMGIAKKAADIGDSDVEANGKLHMKDFGYSVDNVGVFAVRTLTSSPTFDTFKILRKDNKVFLANDYAFYQIMKEVCKWWVDEMPSIVKQSDWKTDDKVRAQLTYLHLMDKAFSTMIPVVDKIYTQKNTNADDMSIEDMVVEADAEDMTISDAFDVDVSKYEEHEDHTSPVSQFYTINSNVGITDFNLDKIVEDVPVNINTEEETQSEDLRKAQERNEKITGQNEFEVSNTQLYSQITIASRMYDYLEDIQKDYAKWAKNKKNKFPSFSKYYEAQKKGQTKIYTDTIKKFSLEFKGDRNSAILDAIKNHYKDTYPAWYSTISSGQKNNRYDDLISAWFIETGSKLTLNGPGQDLKNIASSDETYLKKIEASMKDQADDSRRDLADYGDNLIDYGVDENGLATSFGSVTFNKYIIEGLGYSASYIPMRTNLYSADTLARYMNDGKETDFYKFYTDYGFMRKALYRDVSSTAVMDYYNAGNTFNGSLKICTLRDLMNLKGEDLALYIDQNFYNAEDACKLGNAILKNSAKTHSTIYLSLTEFLPIWEKDSIFSNYVDVMLNSVSDPTLKSSIMAELEEGQSANASTQAANASTTQATAPDAQLLVDFDKVKDKYTANMKSAYKFDIGAFKDTKDLSKYVDKIAEANNVSQSSEFTDVVLKNKDNVQYDPATRSYLADVKDSDYVNLSNNASDFTIDMSNESIMTDDNMDSIVLSSAQINQYMSGQIKYDETLKDEDELTEITNTYTSDIGYTPLLPLSYVSCLYRSVKDFTLANTVATNLPVFMASDDMTTIKESNQWYRNTLLNYALVKNLRNNAQVDLSYVTDLDNPLYMDIFGNIITESGIVVIPAASNATLHVGSFRDYNYSLGLYTCYGSDYKVPADLEEASTVLKPMFTLDNNAKEWTLSDTTMNVGSRSVRFDKLDTYDADTQDAVRQAYMASVSQSDYTKLNWPVMVNIVNEVMRGAPIEAIDKDKEGIAVNQTKSGLVAASKLESLEKSLKGQMSNTLLCIPDFSRMDNLEYWVALLIKLMMVATAAVVIITVYRDGIQQRLGLHTAIKCLAAVALTFSCIVVVPAVFQLTYYSANKFLLGKEALRILMVNEEKRQGGAEIGITDVKSVESKGEFALQLDWITIPWYKQLENMLYSSTLDNLQKVKLEAYRKSPVYDNEDISMYNDGVYVTTDALFDSVSMDYTFDHDKDDVDRGLYLHANQPTQTTSFYSPYYVFLRTLTANVNEFNRYRNVVGDNYEVYGDKKATAQERAYQLMTEGKKTTNEKGEEDTETVNNIGAYNYTTKYMSGNRLKTVGLCQAYFNSKAFMENDEDILRLRQIYMAESYQYDAKDKNGKTITKNYVNIRSGKADKDTHGWGPDTPPADWQDNRLAQALCALEYTSGRAMLYDSTDREEFRSSYWFDNNLLSYDQWAYDNLTKRMQDANKKADDPKNSELAAANEARYDYIDKKMKNFDAKVTAMDNYARDFIADNKDMLNKVTDETFIKIMALAMSIKYNQLFGVPSANAVEIFNMDSDDLLRLCIVPIDESIMAAPMSYSRYVYTFGGEPSIYVAAVLTVILWIGSFIKPLCTVIVFISVFLSIFVFRVVLRRESANLWGYFITTVLLCSTNILHALILKVGVALPNFGLPTMACLIFITVSQVAYLLVLGYVTGVALKDWTNLGAAEYEKETNFLRRKFGNTSSDMLNGRVPHYDNNWDYYDSLVKQHRSRNYN